MLIDFPVFGVFKTSPSLKNRRLEPWTLACSDHKTIQDNFVVNRT